jgi:DNA/RNA endonuclease YhcR with UshA esterase domain
MKTIITITFILFIAAGAGAQTAITSQDTKDHVGETVTVSGKVFDVFTTKTGKTLINFDNKYPNQTFTVVVNEDSKVDISAIKAGSVLTISGLIKTFKDKPEMFLDTQDQIIKVE